jgi:hypothetical protein
MTVRRAAAIATAVALLGVAAWYTFGRSSDPASIIRERLDTLAERINQSTVDGAGMAARAAELGSYLTEDIEVDFGPSAAPIRGRGTVVGMADRLQPRTAAFRLRFEDVNVMLNPGGESANVHLTAEIVRRSITTGEESLDAREFSLVMRSTNGLWQIARVTAIQTLKQ